LPTSGFSAATKVASGCRCWSQLLRLQPPRSPLRLRVLALTNRQRVEAMLELLVLRHVRLWSTSLARCHVTRATGTVCTILTGSLRASESD